jgi:hypothetical protein
MAAASLAMTKYEETITLSFLDGPNRSARSAARWDQTSDAQLRIGESRAYWGLQDNVGIPGSRLARAPE